MNTGAVRSSRVSIVSGLAGVADGASPEEDATTVASVDAIDCVGGHAALQAAADFGGIGGRDVPIGLPMTSAPCSVLAQARLHAGASIGVSGVGLGLTSPVCTGGGVCTSLRAAVGAGGEGVCGVSAGGAKVRLGPGALCSPPIGTISAASGGRVFRESVDFFFRNIVGRMVSDELVVAVVAVVASGFYLIGKVVVRGRDGLHIPWTIHTLCGQPVSHSSCQQPRASWEDEALGSSILLAQGCCGTWTYPGETPQN